MRHIKLMIILLLLVACSNAPSDINSSNTMPNPSEQNSTAINQGIYVTSAWSRELPPGAKVTVGFMQINNLTNKNDTLISVQSDAAERVEIHEMKHENGIMKMRHLEQGLPLIMGSVTTLESGGNHLMFINPRVSWKKGERIKATLNFEFSESQVIELEVRGL